jgi:argininosuccinate lyase
LAALSDADLLDAHPQLGPEVRRLLGVENAINAFRSYGSTAPAEVEKQLDHWIQRLSDTH